MLLRPLHFFSTLAVRESTRRALFSPAEETRVHVQQVRQHHPGVSQRPGGNSPPDGDQARRGERLNLQKQN